MERFFCRKTPTENEIQAIATFIYSLLAVVGYLMFGNSVSEEVTVFHELIPVYSNDSSD
jgi:hypothetical protein